MGRCRCSGLEGFIDRARAERSARLIVVGCGVEHSKAASGALMVSTGVLNKSKCTASRALPRYRRREADLLHGAPAAVGKVGGCAVSAVSDVAVNLFFGWEKQSAQHGKLLPQTLEKGELHCFLQVGIASL